MLPVHGVFRQALRDSYRIGIPLRATGFISEAAAMTT